MRRQLLPATALLGAAVLVPGAGAQAPQKVSKSVPTSSPAASGATSGASNGARNGATNGAAESGAFVVRLGADTVAAEQWTRTPGANGARLEGDVFNRAPIARVTHYVVDLDAGGRPTRAEITTRRPDGTPMPNQSRNTVYTFRGDSAFAELQMPDSVARVRAAAPAGTFPNVANSYALWETAVPGGWDASPYATRQRQRRDEARAVVLAATDPANPYGGALPWPERAVEGGHKPGRKAGALVVLVDGALVLYVERGGKTLLSFSSDDSCLPPAVDALALAVRDGALGRLTVTKADGEAALTSPLGLALEAAGFRPTPRGLRLRA